MDKNSFILYTEYSKHIELLTNEQAGVLFKNIFSYIESGQTSDMDAVTQMAFSFIKANLDRDIRKYEEIIDKRRKAGAIGGHTKAQNRLANVASAKCDRTNVANVADNDNDNENVNVNDKYKRKSNKFCDYPQREIDFDAIERKVFKN